MSKVILRIECMLIIVRWQSSNLSQRAYSKENALRVGDFIVFVTTLLTLLRSSCSLICVATGDTVSSQRLKTSYYDLYS